MIEKTTFTFRAEKGKKLPWDAVTKYGQTVKVIYGPGIDRRKVMTAAWRWSKKTDVRRLKPIVDAQSFIIFECCPHDEKTRKDPRPEADPYDKLTEQERKDLAAKRKEIRLKRNSHD